VHLPHQGALAALALLHQAIAGRFGLPGPAPRATLASRLLEQRVTPGQRQRRGRTCCCAVATSASLRAATAAASSALRSAANAVSSALRSSTRSRMVLGCQGQRRG